MTFCDCNGYSFSFCSHFVDQLGSNQSLQRHHAKSKFRACKGCPVALKLSCLHGPFALLRGCRYVVLMRSLMQRCGSLPKMTLFLPCERKALQTRPFSNWFLERANRRLANMDIPLNIANMDIPWYLSYPKFQVTFGSRKAYASKDQHVIFLASHVQDDNGITMSLVQTTMINASWIFCKANLSIGGLRGRPHLLMQLPSAGTWKCHYGKGETFADLFFPSCLFFPGSRKGWRWFLPALPENCWNFTTLQMHRICHGVWCWAQRI